MPVWIFPFLNWTKNRLINFIVYALIGLAVWGVFYKLFMKDTSKTVIQSGGRQVNVYSDVPKVALFNFGCSNLQVDAYWKKTRLINGTERVNVKN